MESMKHKKSWVCASEVRQCDAKWREHTESLEELDQGREGHRMDTQSDKPLLGICLGNETSLLQVGSHLLPNQPTNKQTNQPTNKQTNKPYISPSEMDNRHG